MLQKITIASRTKHDCTSAQCIFDRNTSVTGHKRTTTKVNYKLHSHYLYFTLLEVNFVWKQTTTANKIAQLCRIM